ncbi:MAG: hypothetical protein BWX58_01538 [Deltaproteobacteria bacterium ADurb.Bin026]|nr:MAG: hypothetical protein BWX58_01538 [Deltaproteobacteria bacterium ADurb.Bin026]
MHDHSQKRTNAKVFLINLRVKTPFGMIIQNTFKNIITMSNYCGYPGEFSC